CSSANRRGDCSYPSRGIDRPSERWSTKKWFIRRTHLKKATKGNYIETSKIISSQNEHYGYAPERLSRGHDHGVKRGRVRGFKEAPGAPRVLSSGECYSTRRTKYISGPRKTGTRIEFKIF